MFFLSRRGRYRAGAATALADQEGRYQSPGTYKEKMGYKSDTELKAEELKQLAEDFKVRIKEVLGTEPR